MTTTAITLLWIVATVAAGAREEVISRGARPRTSGRGEVREKLAPR